MAFRRDPLLGAAATRLPVSVVIPALDRADLLPRCLASVWAQRPALPAEVIVVDDGSSDATAEVAAAHGATVIRHPENRGLAAARNTGVEAAGSEWVAFLDSDDEWLPGHLDHLFKLHDSHALVGSSSLSCPPDSRQDRFHGPLSRGPIVLRSPDRLIAPYNIFTVSACMLKRDVALRLGGFRPVWGVEDMDLWVRVLEHHTAICSPCVTVIYHVHGDQMSSRLHEMLGGHRKVAQDYRDRTGGAEIALERWEGVAAWDTMRLSLSRGERRAAIGSALGLLHGPQRLAGLGDLLWSRFRERRRSSRLGRDGKPSVAVMLSDRELHRAFLAKAGDRPLRDLSDVSTMKALMTLARRPVGLAVVSSTRQAALVRAVGVRALPVTRALGEPSLPSR